MSWICSTFGHRRSKAHARKAGDEWVSRCKSCGIRMVRLGPGEWETMDDSEPSVTQAFQPGQTAPGAENIR